MKVRNRPGKGCRGQGALGHLVKASEVFPPPRQGRHSLLRFQVKGG